MNKKEKKKPTALIWIAVIIFIYLISEVEYFDSDAIIGIVVLIIAAAVIFAVIRSIITAARTSKGETVTHSHDRLSNNNTIFVESIDGFEHYKRQLDGFLEAGIIDKNEYKVLFRKYRETLSK